MKNKDRVVGFVGVGDNEIVVSRGNNCDNVIAEMSGMRIAYNVEYGRIKINNQIQEIRFEQDQYNCLRLLYDDRDRDECRMKLLRNTHYSDEYGWNV